MVTQNDESRKPVRNHREVAKLQNNQVSIQGGINPAADTQNRLKPVGAALCNPIAQALGRGFSPAPQLPCTPAPRCQPHTGE